MSQFRTRCVSLCLCAAVLMLFAVPTSHAQQPVTEDDVNAVAAQMFCPECENIPLDQCNTEACLRWRADIRRQLEAGRTPDQIIADFVARYGEQAAAVPQNGVLRGLSFGVPLVASVLAIVLAVVVLVVWIAQRPARPYPATLDDHSARPRLQDPQPLDEDALRRHLEADLNR